MKKGIPITDCGMSINTVLEHYEGYIIFLSTRKMYDESGQVHFCVDEILRWRLEAKLLKIDSSHIQYVFYSMVLSSKRADKRYKQIMKRSEVVVGVATDEQILLEGTRGLSNTAPIDFWSIDDFKK